MEGQQDIGGVQPPKKPPPPESVVGIQAWNMMGGQLDWAGLPIVSEMLGVHDPELLVVQLIAIRNFHARR